jgi:hypothetical protein
MNNEDFLRTLRSVETIVPVIVLQRAEELFPSLAKNVSFLFLCTLKLFCVTQRMEVVIQ